MMRPKLSTNLRRIAARLGATVAQVAIAWVLHQPGVAATLVGTRDGKHLAENAGGASLTLPDDVLEDLEQLIPLGPLYADYGYPLG